MSEKAVMAPDETAELAALTWPEPLPIRAELRPVETLPPALLPDSFAPWLTDISDRMGCPLDFVATAALVMAGAVIGAGCGIRPKRLDDWTVVPNLWGGVVGRPSVMLKTPALQEATRALERLAADSSALYERANKEFEAQNEMFKAQKDAARESMRKAARGKKGSDSTSNSHEAMSEFLGIEEPAKPVWRRYKTNDATVEKLGELLAANPRGLLVYRDELIGLLSQWDRDGREGERAFFLEAWNGTGSHETDRIGRGSVRIENACVSILGGIQPSKLSSYLYGAMRGNDNDGLMQRFQLLVYPDEPAARRIVDRTPDRDARDRAFSVIKRIAEMDFVRCGATAPEQGTIPYFRFDEAAQNLFYQWFDDLSQKLRSDEEPVLIEHLGKFRKLMPSLALILHVLDIADGAAPGPVTESAALRAAALCEYFESHARRIYGLVTDIQIEAAARLAKKVATGELGDLFSPRDVYRRQWSLLTEREIVERACEELVDRGWIRAEIPMATIGRPPSTQYSVNPRVRTSVSLVSALPPHFQEEQ
jgi:hypothetical protein